MSGCFPLYIIVGILLSLTGIGAIIGIPLIIMGVSGMGLDSTTQSLKKMTEQLKARNEKNTAIKALCPYCNHLMSCPKSTPGINCPACDQRVIVRDGVFVTIEQAKKQEAHLVLDFSSEEEGRQYKVVLVDGGRNKIRVLKLLRSLTGLGLKEAKDLIDAVPKTVKAGLRKAEAQEMQSKLEEAGAVIKVYVIS